jgi:thiamine kinase-like enzyme
MHIDYDLTIERCRKLMPELHGRSLEITELKGGITNKLYRVRSEPDYDYVVRIYGQKTEMFIDRDIETRTMKLIEPLRISPKVIHYLPKQHITVTEYLDAYTLKNPDFLKEELWPKIVQPVQLVHDSRIILRKVFHPLTEIKRMHGLLNELGARFPEFAISETIDRLEKIDEKAGLSPEDYVLCHNDLLAENFLLPNGTQRDGAPMYLIDWEYAGMGYRYYELGDMFQEILVPREVELKLMALYFRGEDMERNVYLTDVFKPFPDIYWFLWSLIQKTVSTIEFDYYNYGRVKFENAQANMKRLVENYGVDIE